MNTKKELHEQLQLLKDEVKNILDDLNKLLPEMKVYLDERPELFDKLKDDIRSKLEDIDVDEETLLEYYPDQDFLSVDSLYDMLGSVDSCDSLIEELNTIPPTCTKIIYERQYNYTKNKKPNDTIIKSK